jgi:hypothetical protein
MPYAVPPRSSQTFKTAGIAETAETGYIRVIPALGTSAAPAAAAVFSFRNGGVTVSEMAAPAVQPASSYRMYAEFLATPRRVPVRFKQESPWLTRLPRR